MGMMYAAIQFYVKRFDYLILRCLSTKNAHFITTLLLVFMTKKANLSRKSTA